MFDSVGRDLDDEALARTAKSGLLTLLLGGSVAAGMFAVKEYVAPVVMEEIIELAQEEAEMEAPPPPPPPPPPPAAAAATEEEQEEDPTPDEINENVQELKDEVKQEMKSDVKPAGVEGGVEGGVVGGVVGGVQGGVVGGVIGGQLGAPLGGTPPKIVHHSEIEWKKKFEPIYPTQAKGLGLGEQTCKVVIKLDEEGVPYDLTIDNCPKIFHDETREALMKWRAYPLKVSGQKVKIQSTILVKYKEV